MIVLLWQTCCYYCGAAVKEGSCVFSMGYYDSVAGKLLVAIAAAVQEGSYVC